MSATNYSINFYNNSTMPGNICVYQQDPDVTNPYVMSLAWFTKLTNPGTKASFTWGISYSFVWDETGQLIPGVIFDASQTLPASLLNNNSITLSKADGAYQFTNQASTSNTGTLYVNNEFTVPPLEASVGIGMSGAGTFVKQAQPNMTFDFTPHPEYWVTFGDFVKGEVLDITEITNNAPVIFPPNVYAMDVILDQSNRWTIKPSAA